MIEARIEISLSGSEAQIASPSIAPTPATLSLKVVNSIRALPVGGPETLSFWSTRMPPPMRRCGARRLSHRRIQKPEVHSTRVDAGSHWLLPPSNWLFVTLDEMIFSVFASGCVARGRVDAAAQCRR